MNERDGSLETRRVELRRRNGILKSAAAAGAVPQTVIAGHLREVDAWNERLRKEAGLSNAAVNAFKSVMAFSREYWLPMAIIAPATVGLGIAWAKNKATAPTARDVTMDQKRIYLNALKQRKREVDRQLSDVRLDQSIVKPENRTIRGL